MMNVQSSLMSFKLAPRATALLIPLAEGVDHEAVAHHLRDMGLDGAVPLFDDPPESGTFEAAGPAVTNDGITLGDLHVHLRGREVTIAGARVVLTRKEHDLLVFFLTHPGRVFTRSEILGEVWNNDATARRTVDTHVRRIRAKLGNCLWQLETVHGVGYVLRQ